VCARTRAQLRGNIGHLLVAVVFGVTAVDSLAGIVPAQVASAAVGEDSDWRRRKMRMDQRLDIFQLVIGLQAGRKAFAVPVVAEGIHDQSGKDWALEKTQSK